jgi:Secretion system C-terminal sorting domain
MYITGIVPYIESKDPLEKARIRHPKRISMKIFFLALAALFISGAAHSQSIPELIFNNATLVSGNAAENGAKYKFRNVAAGIDAVIEIKGRSANDVVLANIDSTGIGWDKAFQPIIGIPDVGANRNWWMEFKIVFYEAGTDNKKEISKFFVTGLDIDGDNGNLNEWAEMKNAKQLQLSTISSLVTAQVPNDPNDDNSGQGSDDANYQVTGPVTNYVSIDTSGTSVMATYEYEKKSSIEFKMGGSTNTHGGSAGVAAMRMNSIWFKQFSLKPPSILPVTLLSFNAMLINHTTNVDLSWITVTEKNVNHFEVEKSFDGKNFTDAGMVFAYGNTTEKMNYKFTDNISTTQSKIIYYRLRTVDEDGKFDYSATRIIRTGGQAENMISLLTYPNPVINELRVTIPGNWQGKKVTYEVINANAQASKRTEVANSSQTETLNVSALTPGFYLVIVTCDGQKAQQKMIKS